MIQQSLRIGGVDISEILGVSVFVVVAIVEISAIIRLSRHYKHLPAEVLDTTTATNSSSPQKAIISKAITNTGIWMTVGSLLLTGLIILVEFLRPVDYTGTSEAQAFTIIVLILFPLFITGLIMIAVGLIKTKMQTKNNLK